MKKGYGIALSILLGIVLVGCSSTNHQSKKMIENNGQHLTEKKVSRLRETQFGKVQGVSDKDTLSWLGVPYGEETSGVNRWQAPKSPKKWDQVLETKKAGSLALQASANGTIGSENALNLDIYRPKNDKKQLPVIVYIHGGNNQTGNAQEISGKSFVSTHDAIVVSVNYRLGVLGFNPLAALKTGSAEEKSGNFGLLDIAFSLDWVKNNIEHFGGQKDNITVAGFSAGGRDVMAMLVSPLFKDKFQRAISFSGGMTIADEGKSQQVFAKALAPLVIEDKVKDSQSSAIDWLLSDDAAVKPYLLTLDSKRLAPLMGNAGIRMEVFPHLYNDGVVIPKKGFDATLFNDVPLLMLTGEQEFSLFGMFDPYFATTVANNTINTDEKVRNAFGFVNKYGGQLYSLFNVNDSSRKLAEHYHSPIYNMEIQFGSDPNMIDKPMKNLASFHGVFVPLLDSQNQNYAKFVGKSYDAKGAKAMQAAFQDYLYGFILKGNPNQKSLPKWTAWTQDSQKNLFLDADLQTYTANMKEKGYLYQDVLANMSQDTTISADQKADLINTVLNGRWFSHELDQKYDNVSDFNK
ncbi:carboxylesterase family protein [Lactococcus carnosus]|uniref:carboxylesterase family protein n=1 Tax=Pseudolactococcus carnosus TaxID=2749961 RepID=UPI000BDA51D7|nr:carboxylesterase family protein [Lactococcus carnosus]SOB48217.1 Carboxylesterase type B [Lactococcus piscium]MCJ1970166.1 carboxylesterase/lipase family protein [Lactococcus carnosus]MCJ1974331.1 carboxylesterase/lipase family protein [Lactococcus carnosus]MCJ1976305.1 carboxylesterase/lipase family protein [Lactococcus carnosus]MCJ1982433.1 carboxylesterase/lipase family protein [Lactococcus carnosus]